MFIKSINTHRIPANTESTVGSVRHCLLLVVDAAAADDDVFRIDVDFVNNSLFISMFVRTVYIYSRLRRDLTL